jgi:hypothetical protein
MRSFALLLLCWSLPAEAAPRSPLPQVEIRVPPIPSDAVPYGRSHYVRVALTLGVVGQKP